MAWPPPTWRVCRCWAWSALMLHLGGRGDAGALPRHGRPRGCRFHLGVPGRYPLQQLHWCHPGCRPLRQRRHTLAAVANAAIVPLVNLLCVLVFARFSARHSSPATVLKAIFANPLIVGCAGGLLLRVTGLGLPPGISPRSKPWARLPCRWGCCAWGSAGRRPPRPAGAAITGGFDVRSWSCP